MREGGGGEVGSIPSGGPHRGDVRGINALAAMRLTVDTILSSYPSVRGSKGAAAPPWDEINCVYLTCGQATKTNTAPLPVGRQARIDVRGTKDVHTHTTCIFASVCGWIHTPHPVSITGVSASHHKFILRIIHVRVSSKVTNRVNFQCNDENKKTCPVITISPISIHPLLSSFPQPINTKFRTFLFFPFFLSSHGRVKETRQ